MLPLTPKHIPNRPSSHGIPLGAGISALRLGKGVRVLRVFRLIRVLKGGGILQELLDTIHSEHCIIIVAWHTANLFSGRLSSTPDAKVLALQPSGLGLPPRTEVNHIIACLWFWVGSSEHAVNWISEAEEERTFTVCVIVSAMVIFSSFISAITNAMTQLRNLNKEKIEQFSLLRKYLTQCNVSGGLLARVLQSMSSAMNKNKRRVHEEDIKVLHLLPLSLRQDMNQEVYSPHFVVHPFFSVCASCFDTYVRKLYSAGLRTKFVPSNQAFVARTAAWVARECLVADRPEAPKLARQEIITSGEQVAADGTTEVICQSDPVDSPVGRKVLYWKTERPEKTHIYSYVASDTKGSNHIALGDHSKLIQMNYKECDVLVLDAAKFQEIFKDDVMVKHYAVAFWEHFMSNPADLTDAWADEDLLFQWSTEALQTAEQCMGSVIEPDHRNTAFSRHVTQKRRSSSAMLDETILKERRVPVAPVAEHHSGARRLEPSSREPLPDMAWFLILQRCHK
ncbi:unnamed protein product [Durusdinium trenchii]|uniref:Uncharacterized protein n=1 Tax=Durusdinium trenchii TaxID=1381693 RepID=A0ABP0M6G1_9DINO